MSGWKYEKGSFSELAFIHAADVREVLKMDQKSGLRHFAIVI